MTFRKFACGNENFNLTRRFQGDEIGLIYLKHCIENSDAGPDVDWKLMLMYDHGSHIAPEFALLADENHIQPYPLIP